MIAFNMPNKKKENGVDYYAATADQVESETVIVFISGLSNQIENKLEGSFDYLNWECFLYSHKSI